MQCDIKCSDIKAHQWMYSLMRNGIMKIPQVLYWSNTDKLCTLLCCASRIYPGKPQERGERTLPSIHSKENVKHQTYRGPRGQWRLLKCGTSLCVWVGAGQLGVRTGTCAGDSYLHEFRESFRSLASTILHRLKQHLTPEIPMAQRKPQVSRKTETEWLY